MSFQMPSHRAHNIGCAALAFVTLITGVCLSPRASYATADLKVSVVNHSPIIITRAFFLVTRDNQMVNCITFRNQGTNVATDVQFRLSFFNAFDAQPLSSFTESRTGTFSPGISIDGITGAAEWQKFYARNDPYWRQNCWMSPLTINPDATQLTFAVSAIRFADGSVWKPDDEAKPAV
jgi:hypothetical protein